MAGKGKDRSTKDKTMAARLKKLGVRRETVRCPMCYRMMPERAFPQHVATMACNK